MTTIAEMMAANASTNGAPVTVTRGATTGEGEAYEPLTDVTTPGAPPSTSFTADAGEGDPEPDDYQSGTLIVRNPVVLILPNAPAVTFAPAQGMTFVWGGTQYTIATVKPRVLRGAVQYWRIVGGV